MNLARKDEKLFFIKSEGIAFHSFANLSISSSVVLNKIPLTLFLIKSHNCSMGLKSGEFALYNLNDGRETPSC